MQRYNFNFFLAKTTYYRTTKNAQKSTNCILDLLIYSSTASPFFGILRCLKPASCRWSLNAAWASGSP